MLLSVTSPLYHLATETHEGGAFVGRFRVFGIQIRGVERNLPQRWALLHYILKVERAHTKTRRRAIANCRRRKSTHRPAGRLRFPGVTRAARARIPRGVEKAKRAAESPLGWDSSRIKVTPYTSLLASFGPRPVRKRYHS